MVVVILDRVLNRHNVTFPVGIDVVNHGGQRCGLTGAGWPSDYKETTGTTNQVLANLRETDLIKGQQAVGDLAQHHADDALLLEHRHAETSGGAEGKAEVRSAHFLQFLLILFRSHALHELHHVLGLKRLGGQVAQATTEADGGRPSAGKMQIAGVLLDNHVKQAVHLQGGLGVLRYFGFRTGHSGVSARCVE